MHSPPFQRLRLPFLFALIFAASPVRAAAEDGPDAVAALLGRIETARSSADFAEAARQARELLRLRTRDPHAQPYEIADAEDLVKTLEFAATLPESAQKRLSDAEQLITGTERSYGNVAGVDEAAAAERQMETMRTILGDGHSDVARAMNTVAQVHHDLGDYDRAETLYREALAIRHKILGSNHPEIAANASDLGQLLFDKGDLGKAMPLYREALEMWKELGIDESPDLAACLDKLATLLQEEGDYSGAEALFRRALSMQRKLLGDDDPGVPILMNNLAYLLVEKGDYPGAESQYREALALYRRGSAVDDANVATFLNGIAVALEGQQDYSGAEPLCREGLALRQRLYGDEHVRVAASLHNLATILSKEGKPEEAKELELQSLALRRKLVGQQKLDLALGLNTLGVIYRDLGQYDKAEAAMREGLAIRQRFQRSHNRHLVMGLYNLGIILLWKGELAEAEAVLEQSAAAYEVARLRAGAGLERSAFVKSPYVDLAYAHLMLGRQEEAWEAAESGLGRTLADLLLIADRRSLDSTESEREDSLRTALGALESELAVFETAARADSTGAALKLESETRGRLLGVEAEWSQLQREIAQKHPITEGQALPLSRVQASLSDSTALIGWLDVRTGNTTWDSWGYVLRRTGPVRWARLAAPADTPADSLLLPSPTWVVSHFRDTLDSPDSDSTDCATQARRLWDARIQPLEGALQGVRELIVIPSGAMVAIPVETLIAADGHCLGDLCSVSYTPSATIRTWLRERAVPPGSGNARPVLLVGDPPFTASQEAEMVNEGGADDGLFAGVAVPRNRSVLLGATRGNRDALGFLDRLPYTRAEVAEVAELHPKATVLLGRDATEQALVGLASSGELRKYGTIHLATHALVDDERPQCSALILSQVDLPDPLQAAMSGQRIYDGLITAQEILREWRLDSDLVTLSGCDTGLGKQVSGEGLVGFCHTFIQVGARNLLVSLWPVSDKATSLLMARFYKNSSIANRDGRETEEALLASRGQALREAKAWLRSYTDATGRHPYAHPYFWSPFILFGEGQ